MTWLHSLRELACNATEYEERTLFISKGVEVALICASTFDVEDKHMVEMLSSTENASTLIQVAIVVQQGDSAQNWKRRYLSLLRLRFTRLLHRCYKSLAGHHEHWTMQSSAHGPPIRPVLPVGLPHRRKLTTGL